MPTTHSMLVAASCSKLQLSWCTHLQGVVVLHKGLTAYTAWFRSHFSITSDDTMLQQTPTNFDASCDELWTSLSAGARLVVAPPEVHRDVHSVMQLITR